VLLFVELDDPVVEYPPVVGYPPEVEVVVLLFVELEDPVVGDPPEVEVVVLLVELDPVVLMAPVVAVVGGIVGGAIMRIPTVCPKMPEYT
jgi:hypothetical protein